MRELNNRIIRTQYSRLLHGVFESVDELIDRVSKTISKTEINSDDYYKQYKRIISQNLFLPSGRILNNAGSKQSQIASCFVLPIKDDFASIFDTLKIAATCHRMGGGTGFNFSKIREKGASISTSEGSGSSGPVSWMKLFNSETSVVMSGGKRRGANIGILSVYHPDILDFVNCKNNFDLKNFNISVLIDNAFMDGVDKDGEIKLISPFTKGAVKKIRAKLIWESIIRQVHKTGDPGLLFLDTINKNNYLKSRSGNLEIANPCGEQIMYSYESSFLGSINLLSFYDEKLHDVRWKELKETIYLAVRFLDDAIDANVYPNKKIEKISKAYRRIGLGIMGFADLLVKLRISYGSEMCLKFIDKIGLFLKENAVGASVELAKQRGSFPKYGFLNSHIGRRNVAITAIAPTGTISMVGNCSSGIEPRFGAYYNKNVIERDGIDYVDKLLLQTLVHENYLSEEVALGAIKRGQYVDLLSEPQKKIFMYAHEINYSWQIKVVAQWQKYIDNGISKTVNVPNDTSYDEIDKLLRLAYKLQCKGITVYRGGSHPQDLIFEKAEEQEIQSKEKTDFFESTVM